MPAKQSSLVLSLPSYQGQDAEMRKVWGDLVHLVQGALNRLATDVAAGSQELSLVSSVPTINTLEKGASVLYNSGATFRLYFNVDDNIKYVTLS